MKLVSAKQINAVLDWPGVLDALWRMHLGARPRIDEYFLGDSEYGLFSRGVILPGLGAGVKIAPIFPGNLKATPPQPAEQAAFLVVDEHTKSIAAICDGPAITSWKTAGDSALAAERLSRQDSCSLLVLGAGPVARALTEAYLHIRPGIRQVMLWNRTSSKLESFAAQLQARGIATTLVADLNEAVGRADIVVSATATSVPLIKGRLVRPGTHVDLVGSSRPDMQKAGSRLPKHLLSVGYRPVIASRRPLAALMTGAWLRQFLEAWDAGLSILNATFKANLVVERDDGSVPQYSLPITVHGDFSLTKDQFAGSLCFMPSPLLV